MSISRLTVYVFLLLGLLSFSSGAFAIAPAWANAHAYAVGDFVRTGDPATTTYVCNAAHVSAFANFPTVGAVWTQVWPGDGPVGAAGAGPTGNDWNDFASGTNPLNRLVAGATVTDNITFILISANNANFALAGNRTTAGLPVTHICFELDYTPAPGSARDVAQGNDWWDWYYGGYVPAVTSAGNATTVTNCVSYAYNGYKGAATVCSNWVNVGNDSTPYRNELTLLAALGANGAYPTMTGDRLHDPNAHVWFVTCITCGPVWMNDTTLEWKNNASRIHTWLNTSPNWNDCPIGAPGVTAVIGNLNVYNNYEVYRK